MNEDKYLIASELIKNLEISVADKLILSSVLFRAERLEKEVERLDKQLQSWRDACDCGVE